MSDMNTLDGYEALKQFVIDAIRKRASDTPSYMFEEEQSIDIEDLAQSKYRSRSSTRGTETTGAEQVLLLFTGRAFDVEDHFNDQSDDSLYSQDEEWFEEQRSEVFSQEAAKMIEDFAQTHDLDPDEIEEYLKDDEELQSSEALEGGLHHNTYSYNGSVPMRVNSSLRVTLRPTSDIIQTLCYLKINPRDWLDAVLADIEEDPDNAARYSNAQNDFDKKKFVDEFKRLWSNAESQGHVFPINSADAIVSAKDLLEKMNRDWNESDCEVMFRFNLDDDHIDDVSIPISRNLDADEGMNLGLWLHGTELAVVQSSDYGDGIELKKRIFCRVKDLQLADSNSEERSAIKTEITGAMGMNLAVHEAILDAMDSGAESDKTLMDRIRGRAFEGPTQQFPDKLTKRLQNIFSKSNDFDVERLSARYPLLRNMMPIEGTKMDPDAMGRDLIDLIGSSFFERQSDWKKAEERERAWWLIQNGANLSLRHGHPQTGIMAMHIAAGSGQIDCLRLMAENGADMSATFLPSAKNPEEHSQAVNAWEMIARTMYNKRQFSGDEDIQEFIDALVWLEDLGVNPLVQKIVTMRDTIASIDEVLARANDDRLSQSHIDRIKNDSADPQALKASITETLFVAVRDNAFSLAKACMDAGARLEDLIPSSETPRSVESLAEEHFKNKSFAKTDGLNEAKVYNAALIARDAIDQMMARMPIAQP